MITYYEEKLKIAEETKSFAEKGFMARIREIGEALTICAKDDVEVLLRHLTLAVEAMGEVEKDYKYAKDRYEEEKERNK